MHLDNQPLRPKEDMSSVDVVLNRLLSTTCAVECRQPKWMDVDGGEFEPVSCTPRDRIWSSLSTYTASPCALSTLNY